MNIEDLIEDGPTGDECPCGNQNASTWDIDGFSFAGFCRACAERFVAESSVVEIGLMKFVENAVIVLKPRGEATEEDIMFAAEQAAEQSKPGDHFSAWDDLPSDLTEGRTVSFLRHQMTNYGELIQRLPRNELCSRRPYLALKTKVHRALEAEYPEFIFPD